MTIIIVGLLFMSWLTIALSLFADGQLSAFILGNYVTSTNFKCCSILLLLIVSLMFVFLNNSLCSFFCINECWMEFFFFFKGDLTNSHEWNPDIISGVVRPPEQIKLVHDLEAIRSVSSLSSSTGMFCSHWQLSCC